MLLFCCCFLGFLVVFFNFCIHIDLALFIQSKCSGTAIDNSKIILLISPGIVDTHWSLSEELLIGNIM